MALAQIRHPEAKGLPHRLFSPIRPIPCLVVLFQPESSQHGVINLVGKPIDHCRVYPSLEGNLMLPFDSQKIFRYEIQSASMHSSMKEYGRFLPSMFIALLLTLFFSDYARAQFDGAEVVGTIRDASGASLPAATVTLTNVKQGTLDRRTTDDKGEFTFPSVQVGEYTVTAEKAGFSISKSDEFAVQIAARQRVDLSLKIGQASDTVTVSGAATLLETDTSDRGEVIDHHEAVDLPLNGRVATDLAILVPGVRLNGQLDTGIPGSREASYNVNGQRSTANNFLLDGLDNNYYSTENQGFSSQVIHPSPDAIEEFKVQTDNYSAEFGRAGGAIINVSTRGGGNNFHGVAYDYLRNTDLNAYGVFLGTGVKPTLIQNQFGATFGGPILKDKLFFFIDYEGFRYTATAFSTSTLPTADQRQGIFTEGYTIPLQNPLTGKVYANGIVPASAQSPFAVAVLAALPANDVAGNSNNYTTLARSTDDQDKGDARIDYALNQKVKIFGRFSKQRFNIFSGPGIAGPAGGGGAGYQYGYNTQVASGLTYVLSPKSLLEARVAFTWTVSGKNPATAGQPSFMQEFNLPGLPAPTSSTPSLNVQSITGFTALGTQSSNPAMVNPYTVNPKVNYIFQRGRHSLKAGYEYLALYLGYDDLYPLYGDDVYGGEFSKGTAAPSGASSTLTEQAYDLADFLIGARSSYTLSGNQFFNYNQRFHFLYVQDDWRVTDRLTLNMGLRYELVTPQWVTGNQLANFNPATNTLINASSGSIYNRALVDMNKLNFAPRFGFAASLDSHTTLRGGYALSYVQGNRNGAEGSLAYNTIADSVINQTTALPLCASANSNPSTCFLTTQQGYPVGFTATQAYTATGGEYRYQPAHSPTGYTQSYQLTVQREITRNTLLDVAYVGAHGVHLRVLQDFNQATPNPGGSSTNCTTPALGTAAPCSSLISRRPIAGFNSIIEPFSAGFATYNSLQVKLRRSLSQGLYLLNSFTYSQAFDNAGAQYEVYNGDGAVVNAYNIAGDRGRSGYDQPLNDTTSLNYDLPYGHGQRFGNHAPYALQALFGGWSIAGINQITSGLPIDLTYDPATSGNLNATVSNASVAYSYRPNISGPTSSVYTNPSTWVKTGTSLAGVFSKTNLSAPLYTQPFGNVSRNSLRGPAYESVNLGLHKKFPLWSESSNLEFRAEAFNLLNSVNYQSPTSDISSSSFGSYTSSSVYPARQLQVALRLSY
jgi:Carboxypeptidase regulatory-like domain/TonB-dependent Receptor Plug Domain